MGVSALQALAPSFRFWETLGTLLGLVGLLLGCVPAPGAASPTPPPTATPPPALLVVRMPELALWDARLRTCAASLHLTLDIQETLWNEDLTPIGDLFLTWGPLPDADRTAYRLENWRAVPVTGLAFRAHPLHRDALRGIYRGTLRTWQALGGPERPLRPLLPPPGHPLFRALENLVRPFPWAPDVRWAPTPRDVLNLLQDDPTGLGWLPEPWWTAHAAHLPRLPLAPETGLGPWPVLAYPAKHAPPSTLPLLGCLHRPPPETNPAPNTPPGAAERER